MRFLICLLTIVFYCAVAPARAELRLWNSGTAPARLAVVWINRADVKTTSVPFTAQGWWTTAPGQCSNIDIDGVLMYYHVWGGWDVSGKHWPASFQNNYPKFSVPVFGTFRHYSASGPMPGGFELPFAKFSAFPLIGKGHWLLLTLQVDRFMNVTEICTATAAGGASLTMKCDGGAPPGR